MLMVRFLTHRHTTVHMYFYLFFFSIIFFYKKKKKKKKFFVNLDVSNVVSSQFNIHLIH